MTEYVLPNGEQMVSVKIYDENRSIALQMRELGLGRFILLDKQGTFRGRVVEPIAETRYTAALNEVKSDEEQGRLPEGSTAHVLGLVISGQFDNSDWALWYGNPPSPDSKVN